MEKKTYARPNIAVISAETDQALLAASLNTNGNEVTWGGNASDNDIEEADARDNNMSIWDY